MALFNTTTSTAESALLGEYWDSVALDNLWPELQFYQFAEKKMLPGGVGKTIHFTRFKRLRDLTDAPADGLQALTEASDTVLQPSIISADEISATVVQYGHGVLFSDFVLLTARFDLIDEALEQLGMDAGWWIDNYTVNTAIRFNGVPYAAGSGGAAASITSDTDLTQEDIYWAGTKMAKMITKKFQTGTWVGIGDPAQLHHVKNALSNNNWMELNKYTSDNIRELKSWSIGTLANIDIYETVNGTSVTSTQANFSINQPAGDIHAAVNCYVFRVLSPGAYGAVNMEGGSLSTYVKKLGSAGWKDLVNQRGGVGVKVFYGARDLDMSNRALEIFSGQNTTLFP